MARRIHVSSLRAGEIELDQSQAHHLRDVLRLKIGSSVELFDDGGLVADATVTRVDLAGVCVRVESIARAPSSGELVIASAVPKGDRADWMIEKLSELGVSRFIPLQTERSVVHPTGHAKHARWQRIATESAKQSRRSGVMQIDDLTELSQTQLSAADLYLSTSAGASPIADASSSTGMAMYIGPEGGWTEREIGRFRDVGLTGVKLTATILRVETAAVAAAAIAATLLVRR